MGGDNGTSNTEYVRDPWDDFIDISTNPSEVDPTEIELVNMRVDQHEKEIRELKEDINRLRQEKNQGNATQGEFKVVQRFERVFERCQQYQLPAGTDAFFLCLTMSFVHWMHFLIVMNSYIRFIDIIWLFSSAMVNLLVVKTRYFSTFVKCLAIIYFGLVCSLFLGVI